MTFLLDEDEALKALLKGMTVTDQKARSTQLTTRKVGVWFGQPDQEVEDQAYPYITIDMIDIAEDVARAMRGRTKPVYVEDPTLMVQGVQQAQGVQGVQQVTYDSDLHNWDIDWPVPVQIDYQITTYARQPRHDRELLSQLLYTRLPFRFGTLNTGPNTVNGTVRRLDVLDVSKRDVTEQGKRLFVNAITVRVSSEIIQSQLNKIYKVQSLTVTGPEGRTPLEPISFTTPTQ